jgi:hypothetical protein
VKESRKPPGSKIRFIIFSDNFLKQDSLAQFNIIAHELSHEVLGTTDYPNGQDKDEIYGEIKAEDLAQKNSAAALKCAENWGYFYEDVKRNFNRLVNAAPGIGYTVTWLPKGKKGAVAETIGGATYYAYGGAYYEPVSKGIRVIYEVVVPIRGADGTIVDFQRRKKELPLLIPGFS